MPADERAFNTIAGVPVHYAREPVAPYGTTGVQRTFRSTHQLFERVEALLSELWARCPHGRADIVVTAGAFVPRTMRNSQRPSMHSLGLAFDLDAIFWRERRFVTKFYPDDRPFYLAIDALCRKYFGTVLDYEYNQQHHDHLHLDLGTEIGFTRSSNAEVKFLQAALTHVYAEPLVIDGVWGPATGGAAEEVLQRLGIGGSLASLPTWIAFLDATIDRGMASERNLGPSRGLFPGGGV